MSVGRRIVLLAVAAFVMAFMSAPAAWATDYHHGNNGEDHGSLCDHNDKSNHDDKHKNKHDHHKH